MQYEYISHIFDSCFVTQYFIFQVERYMYECKFVCYCTPDDKKHHIYRPAITYYNPHGMIVYIEYWKDNQLHNEHGPAATYYYPNGTISRTECYINNRRHNEYKPAVINYHENGDIDYVDYYHDGVKVEVANHNN